MDSANKTPKYDAEFLFRETTIMKDREPIGAGAFGEVRYARCDNLLCAAKCVHDILLEEFELLGDRGIRGPMEEFKKEYAYLSCMRHPNIVQYIGYYVDRAENNKRYLLMELMDESLKNYLERLNGPVPFHKTIDFTHDIARGLDYLHYNGIMHCDLSANNVLLLAACRAKISDFGQSVLVNAETGHYVCNRMAPGTLVYMPPEALREDRPEFTYSIDIFSLGVLMIQILTRLWPEPSNTTTVIEGNGSASPDVVLPVKETIRRGSHLAMISHRHPLSQLAIYCIKDDENERPLITEICNRLSDIKEVEPEYNRSQRENPFNPIRHTIALDGQFEEVQELQKQIKILQENNELLESEAVQLKFVIGKQNMLIEQGTSALSPSSSTPLPVQDFVVGNKKWRWYPCKKIPVPLYGKSAVAISNQAYVSGQMLNIIYEFDPDSNSWATLPTVPNSSFALVSIGGILTTVGGYNKQSYSNVLYSLVKGKKNDLTWQQIFPPMKDSRVSPGAASNERYVVVAGGEQQVPGKVPYRLLTDSVEILDIQTKMWIVGDRLPKPVKRLSLTLCGDWLCVLGGVCSRDQPLQEMFFTSLQTLVSSAFQHSIMGDVGRTGNSWQTSCVPVVYAACTVLGGNIILVGGWDDKPSNAIYLYNPRMQLSDNPWHYIGTLANTRMDAICTVLPGERMVVIGGRSQDQQEPVLSAAEIACPI